MKRERDPKPDNHPLRVTPALEAPHQRMLAVRAALDDMTSLRGHVPVEDEPARTAGPGVFV